MDFFDGLHCKDSGIRKFFPGIPQALESLRTGSAPDPLAVTPRVGAEQNTAETTDAVSAE